MATPDWTRLLNEARQGSQAALGELLETCRAYLLHVANQEMDPLLRPKAGPSDLVQQTFLEAQRDFDRFDGLTPDALLAWLRQVLRNNVNNFARGFRNTAKRDVAREIALASAAKTDYGQWAAADSGTPSRFVMAREHLQHMDRALAGLEPDYRQVILYRHRDENTFEEIGQRLGRSANAARKLWVRAIQRLREAMEEKD